MPQLTAAFQILRIHQPELQPVSFLVIRLPRKVSNTLAPTHTAIPSIKSRLNISMARLHQSHIKRFRAFLHESTDDPIQTVGFKIAFDTPVRDFDKAEEIASDIGQELIAASGLDDGSILLAPNEDDYGVTSWDAVAFTTNQISVALLRTLLFAESEEDSTLTEHARCRLVLESADVPSLTGRPAGKRPQRLLWL